MKVRTLAAANEDNLTISRTINGERAGWGDRFLDELAKIAETLERFPQLYPPAEDGLQPHEVRNAVMDRFDYRVIYLVRPDEAVILAVSHTSRRPYHWHRRLADPAL